MTHRWRHEPSSFTSRLSGPSGLFSQPCFFVSRKPLPGWRGWLCGFTTDRRVRTISFPTILIAVGFFEPGLPDSPQHPFYFPDTVQPMPARPTMSRSSLCPSAARLRVVQLTDIHAGVYMTREEIRRYADQVIALQAGPLCHHGRLHFKLDTCFSRTAWRSYPGSRHGTAFSPRWATMNAGMAD